MHSQFTLYFDGSFWVGVYEIHHSDGTVQASQHVFGAEPSDAELWMWMLTRGNEIIDRAHASVRITPDSEHRSWHARNPKRLARLVAKEVARPKMSTAAHEALARAREEQKSEARATRTHRKQVQAQARYEKRLVKRREKRRGH